VLGSALLVRARRHDPPAPHHDFRYAVVVMAIPFCPEGCSWRWEKTAPRRRSERHRRGARAQRRPGIVLGVLAYPPSLPFYLGRPIAVATETGRELTSN